MKKPPAASQAERSKRTRLLELIGGAVVVVIFFVVQRLRPTKRAALEAEPPTRTFERPEASQPHTLSTAVTALDAPAEYTQTFSIWPLVVAAGVALTAFGVVTNVTFAIFGILVFFIGVIAWAGELVRE